MPKFSIIVPVYNVEREYLEAALNSVLAQTFSDWECICVDDGSTNDSGRVLDEFTIKDPRFKVYHQTNQGVSAARNLALDKAEGEWITFLDADDLLPPNKLQALFNLILKYDPCKVIRNRVEAFDEHAVCIPITNKVIVDGVYDLSTFVPFGIVGVCEFSLHSSVVGTTRFLNFRNGEDGIFFFECIKKIPNYVYTTDTLYSYRQRQSSSTHSNLCASLLDGFKSIIYRIKMFQTDKRTIYLTHSPFVITSICHDYVTKIARLPRENRKPLWDAWFDSLEFLASIKEFHYAYRLMFKICDFTHSKSVSYLLSGIGLAIAWRLKIPFAYPLSPEAWAKESSRVIELDIVSANTKPLLRDVQFAPAEQ